MPTLQEILAAKKAASAGIEQVKPVDPTVINVEAKEVPASQVKTIAEPVKEEPATLPEKKLSFAEMMAAKKAGVVPATATVVPTESPKPTQPPVTTAPVPAATSSPAVPATIPVSADTTTPLQVTSPSSSEEVPTEVRQAYADIKEKIDLLNAMSGDDLKNAMSNLKKALMANPSAVSLMEDTDIGQMVIALRKLTGEDIAEASKEKTPGRKKATKMVDLSNPDVMAQVFDEL